MDESAPLTGPPRPLSLSKFVSCHQYFFLWWGLLLHVEISVHFHCTIFAGLEMHTLAPRQCLLPLFPPPDKKSTNFPDFGMNFETQNTNGPPHFSVSCDNRPTKDCRTMLRFSLGFLVQEIRGKNRGVLPGPYAPPPPICSMES